ncbi:chemotaxis-specific protein-glutamate methyltransferase CheB [Sulfitobacter sp. D35]|uniref:chemotaxis-specific protein-glutamate methyltransferase CheB n=1 Tax=Sulfitobacter sp. D35 TaxID=3083252 RepID=UPI00296F8A3A|nr:chemotaxis-specific protein-glutamate methyltransferase CheB [Sulfitobacter sp. D35]MDW4497962.1 chemotaxis-specific protein-glutamate methyltransferase CheB [Sulfitobacter sp. D35]
MAHSRETNASPRLPHRKTVLIVDDSRTARAWLRGVLSGDDRLEVVAEAGDAIEARDFLRQTSVDVLTLDIEMPGMSGLDFLSRLMGARPMPVVMMSSLTAAGSEAAIQALSRGAVDCMVKPTSGCPEVVVRDIRDRVHQAACTRPENLRVSSQPARSGPVTAPRDRAPHPCLRGDIVLIGASTGGVAALETVLPALDCDGPPVVVVQHMPHNFLVSFCDRLDRCLNRPVMLAAEGLTLARGDIVLAPGGDRHTTLVRQGGAWHCRLVPNLPRHLHCPAVDVLFASAESEARHVSAALLTGLGKDGADGLLRLSRNGATTFGQDAATCVVYGMPRAAAKLGAVQHELPLDRIGAALNASRQPRERGAGRRMCAR